MKLLSYHTDMHCNEESILVPDTADKYHLYCFSTPFLYWNEGKYNLGQKDEILICTPGTTVRYKPTSDNAHGVCFDQMKIEAKYLSSLLEKFPLPLNQSFGVGKDFFFRGYIKRIVPEWDFRNPGYELIVNSAITEMVVAIYRAYIGMLPYRGIHSNIYALRKEIIAHPERNRTLEEMAEQTGYSVCRFSQLYNQLFNISPINDVIVQRINLAKKLLLTKHYSISEVADMCGFHSLNYFSRRFRKHTGRTPTQYIQSSYK